MKKQDIIGILQTIYRCGTGLWGNILYIPQAIAYFLLIKEQLYILYYLLFIMSLFFTLASVLLIQKIIRCYKEDNTPHGENLPNPTSTDTPPTAAPPQPKGKGKKGRPKKSTTKTAGAKTTPNKTGKKGRPRKSATQPPTQPTGKE